MDDNGHRGTLLAVNSGEITTEGVIAEGVDAQSAAFSGNARVEAINTGTVRTSGDGARGVRARMENGAGLAWAQNYGTIATSGSTYDHPDWGLFSADGLRADNEGNGNASAWNRQGGTITVTGDGVRAIFSGANNRGTAIATNSGMAVNEGDSTADSRSAGVQASSYGGLARAQNFGGGEIVIGTKDGNGARAGGAGARGLYADNWGDAGYTGKAEALNWGTVTHYGDSTASRTAAAVEAWSRHNSAYAENSGTIVHEGARGRGLYAASDEGTRDDSALAVNHGTITVSGAPLGDTLHHRRRHDGLYRQRRQSRGPQHRDDHEYGPGRPRHGRGGLEPGRLKGR